MFRISLVLLPSKSNARNYFLDIPYYFALMFIINVLIVQYYITTYIKLNELVNRLRVAHPPRQKKFKVTHSLTHLLSHYLYFILYSGSQIGLSDFECGMGVDASLSETDLLGNSCPQPSLEFTKNSLKKQIIQY